MTVVKQTPAAMHAAKKLSRLAAVQALYQNNYELQSLAQIMKECVDQNFAALRDEEDGTEAIAGQPDHALFKAIVEGVVTHNAALDEMITGALDAKFSLARLELLLRTVLRAGVFELYHHSSIPAGVIINDYVDVARAFFNGKEPGLVNGILDKVAGKLRAA